MGIRYNLSVAIFRLCEKSRYLFALYYYIFYPQRHVRGAIEFFTWKSSNPHVQKAAKTMLTSGTELTSYHLAKLVMMNSVEDTIYVGW